jgi:hypothetical protein
MNTVGPGGTTFSFFLRLAALGAGAFGIPTVAVATVLAGDLFDVFFNTVGYFLSGPDNGIEHATEHAMEKKRLHGWLTFFRAARTSLGLEKWTIICEVKKWQMIKHRPNL